MNYTSAYMFFIYNYYILALLHVNDEAIHFCFIFVYKLEFKNGCYNN